MIKYLNGMLDNNYHLTFSYTGYNVQECINVLNNNGNVAVVFKNGLPKTFLGFKVIDGDKTDLTFLNDKQVIIGLKVKGDKLVKRADLKFIVDSSTL